MKRLFSMMLLVSICFTLCSAMTGCKEATPSNATTYDFYGLEIVLPDGYEKADYEEDGNAAGILFENKDQYTLVAVTTMRNDDGMNASKIRDNYYYQAKGEFLQIDDEGDEYEIRKGSKNGTPYFYACLKVNSEPAQGGVYAFYATSDRIWMVQIYAIEPPSDKYVNEKLMSDTVTGWKCK